VTDSHTTVHIVDDDESLRTALARLLRSAGHRTHLYASAGDFLLHQPRSTGPGCVLLDVSMPGPSGLDLFEAISAREDALPVVFLTAHANVRMGVDAMKTGAVDFLEKPVEREPLLAAIDTALTRDREWRAARAVRERIESLTPRERIVMDAIVDGNLNKQIASKLGTSERTVKTQRASVMQKLAVDSVAELVQAVTLAFPIRSQDGFSSAQDPAAASPPGTPHRTSGR
jgi:FixJ family two-component response regulator